MVYELYQVTGTAKYVKIKTYFCFVQDYPFVVQVEYYITLRLN